MTNSRTEELLRADRDYIIHPGMPVGGKLRGMIFKKARGLILEDTEGNEYIDVSSQLVNLNLGHGRREIIDAIVKQTEELQYADLFYGGSHKAIIECAQKLAQITPAGLRHFIFTAGGSEANEYAFKFSRLHWQKQGKNKFKIIALRHSYHGVSYGAMTATGTARGMLTAGYEPLVPGFIHIPSYYCYRCEFGKEYPDCGVQCAKFLEETIVNEGPDSVAALLAEPMQGSGGLIPPPPEWWPMVRKICTKHNVLLIADEVMSGFCRTGKMFALEHWGVVPDMMTMSKGIDSAYLPFGALAVSDAVFEGLKGSLFSGFSSFGNPICSAAASAAIDVYINEKVAEHVTEVGQHARKRLDAEFTPLPCVGDVRGLGLFLGMELVADKATKATFDPALNVSQQLYTQLLERGLFARIYGDVLFFTPPLIITKEEVDRAIDILYLVLANLRPAKNKIRQSLT